MTAHTIHEPAGDVTISRHSWIRFRHGLHCAAPMPDIDPRQIWLNQGLLGIHAIRVGAVAEQYYQVTSSGFSRSSGRAVDIAVTRRSAVLSAM